jgi:hypothetical protein
MSSNTVAAMEHNNSIKRLLDDHDGKVGGKVKILEGIIILTLVFPTRIFHKVVKGSQSVLSSNQIAPEFNLLASSFNISSASPLFSHSQKSDTRLPIQQRRLARFSIAD